MFYGENIKSNKVSPLTREKFDQLTAASTLAGLDWEVETIYKAALENPEKWTAKVIKTRIDANKQQRPYICTSDFVSEEQGARSEELNASTGKGQFIRSNKYARWSGYCSLDIDHIGTSPQALYEAHIKGKEEELGISLVFISPSMHGLKIIFKIAKDIDIPTAQAALAHEIGVEFDSCTKDAARATFLVGRSNILYLDDNFLKEKVADDYRMPFDLVSSEKCVVSSDPAAKAPLHTTHSSLHTKKRWRCKRPTKRVMMIMEVAMRSRSITRASFMIKGQRHTQLLNLLSTQVGRLLTKEEFMGGFLKLCPKFRKEDNLWQLVSDFYEKYLSEEKPVSDTFNNTFRQVLNIDDEGRPLESVEGRMKSEEFDSSSIDNQENSSLFTLHSSLIEEDDKTTDWEKYGFNNVELPPAIFDTIKNYPDRLKLPVLISLLPLLGAYADGVRVRYIDNTQEPLALMAIVVGEMASGKSNCKRAIDCWRKPMQESDDEARQVEEKWRKECKGRKANEKAQPDPQVFIKEVPITISCSALLRRMKLARGRCIYSFGEELDTLRKTNSAGNWSSKYDIYRMAFDNAVWGQDYNSDQAESGMVNVAYNWTILGTYGSLNKCFKVDDIENGLGSRIMLAEMPDNRFEPITKFGNIGEVERESIAEAAQSLREKACLLELPRLDAAAMEWLEKRRLEALRNVDYIEDTFRKRASVIAFRAAAIMQLLSEGDYQCIDSFYKGMADYVLHEQMRLFGSKLSCDSLPSRSDYGTCNIAILERLPKTFTREDLFALRKGKSSISNVYSIIRRWKQNKLIKEVEKNKFVIVK